MTSSLIIWLIVGAVALGIDIVTNVFLFVWFTIGAIAAIMAEIFDYSFLVQFIAFISVSGISMLIGYPMVKKTIKKSVKPTLTREETYIGKELTIDKDIVDSGSIKIDGVYWNIINEGVKIQKGDKVKIIGMKGNKIIIKKL